MVTGVGAPKTGDLPACSAKKNILGKTMDSNVTPTKTNQPMKKITMCLLAIAVLLTTACKKDENTAPNYA